MFYVFVWFYAFGKDEVTSSNLVSSSKNPEFRKKFGIFRIQKLLIFEADFSEKLR